MSQAVMAWVLVHASERPDLVDQIRDLSFHMFTCANCHQQSGFDETVLVFRPKILPNVLYSLSADDDEKRTREKAVASRAMLKMRLGKAYMDEMTTSGILVPYPILHLAIDRDLEADMLHLPIETLACTDQEMIIYQEMLGNVRIFREPESIEKSGVAFMSAPSWSACLAILRANPQLLTHDFVDIIDFIVKLIVGDKALPDMVKTAIERRRLIERCREVGASSAIREKQKELNE
jgi:hypothetical protein